MDKTYFFEVPNRFDSDKLVYCFTKRYKGENLENYAQRTIVLQFYDLLAHYGVDYNEHVSRIMVQIEGEERQSKQIILNVELNDGEKSKSYIRSRIGVLQPVQSTPKNITVYGANSEYLFVVKNITEDIPENLPGIYLFTVLVEDSRPSIAYSHSILKFDSIDGSNKEAIEFAKGNGAYNVLYCDCGSENKRQEIIEDIKNGINYKFQLEAFPYLGMMLVE